MIRWLLAFLALVSPLLGLAMLLVWARTYDVSDRIRWARAGHERTIETRQGYVILTSGPGWSADPDGRAGVGWRTSDTALPPRPQENAFRFEQGPTRVEFHAFGMGLRRHRYDEHGSTSKQLTLPIRAIVVASTLPTVVWAAARWRRRRRLVAKGLCPVCKYDLRATPRKCPECGWRA